MRKAELKQKIEKTDYMYSQYLKRKVRIDVVVPPSETARNKKLMVLLMNDGQDFKKLGMAQTLKHFWHAGGHPFLFVGIHANQDRVEEYGTAKKLDYAGRGRKAQEYQKFLVHELLPALHRRFPIKARGHVLCGFSLGGLSAFDTVINHKGLFDKVGVFSGSFWWRSRNIGSGYLDQRDRIVHARVQKIKVKKSLACWFECGTDDEDSDRNKNGVIDAIEDTLDLIDILKQKGLEDIHYEEIKGGKHDLDTWKKVMPRFLSWAFQ